MPDATARHGPSAAGDDGGGAGHTALPGGDPLAELVLRLRGAGLDPDAEQLCDALWLARWTRPADAADGGPPVTAGPAARPGSRPVSYKQLRAHQTASKISFCG
ncbi:hypothetical protein, partial [Streptomyces olivaceus]|uniref:hypothetical protein n=1 Tax=Streptomyces olivaceus TaxID=47716 RepID=UPI004055E9C9